MHQGPSWGQRAAGDELERRRTDDGGAAGEGGLTPMKSSDPIAKFGMMSTFDSSAMNSTWGGATGLGSDISPSVVHTRAT